MFLLGLIVGVGGVFLVSYIIMKREERKVKQALSACSEVVEEDEKGGENCD